MKLAAEVKPAAQVEPGSSRGDDAVVRIRELHKSFVRADESIVRAIDDVSLDVHRGEFVVLLGPSGCGKTTLLRAVAGLEHPDSGSIDVASQTVYSSSDGIEVAPERRPVSMVFQSYALWPHMTAFKNVSYPLESERGARRRKEEIAVAVRRALTLVGIPELEGQHPSQLSGGQQQRVALARSLVRGDGLILFDEPLSNVDAKVRDQLRMELLSMQRDIGFSALFVTHDQVEAMELAHRIAVLNTGKIEQFGTPREIYDQPATRYVANFIGRTNEFVGSVARLDSGGVAVDSDAGRVVGRSGSSELKTGDSVVAVCRPERCHVTRDEPDCANRWHGLVRAALFVGSHTEYVVDLDIGCEVSLWNPRANLLAEGTPVWISVNQDDLRVLPA